jgi:hypothetical protein
MQAYDIEAEKRAYVAIINKAIKQIEAWICEKRDLATHMHLDENIKEHVESLREDITILTKLTRATIAEGANVETFTNFNDTPRLNKLCEWLMVIAQDDEMDFS